MNDRARFIEYKDISIFLLDLSGIREMEDSKAILKEAAKRIREQPRCSVYLLTDVNNANYDMNAIESLKEFSTSITPHIKASCVIGVSGIKKIVLTTMIKLTGRDIHPVDTRQDALEFLYQRSKAKTQNTSDTTR